MGASCIQISEVDFHSQIHFYMYKLSIIWHNIIKVRFTLPDLSNVIKFSILYIEIKA